MRAAGSPTDPDPGSNLAALLHRDRSSHSRNHHGPRAELDLPREVHWEGKTDPYAPQQPGNQYTFISILTAIPSCHVCCAQDYIILAATTQASKFNINLFMVSARYKQICERAGNVSSEKDKDVRVHRRDQRASPGAGAKLGLRCTPLRLRGYLVG